MAANRSSDMDSTEMGEISRTGNGVHKKSSVVRQRNVVVPVTDHAEEQIIDPVDFEPEGHGCCGYFVICLGVFFFIIFSPILIFFSFTVIQSYERGIRLRLGKLRKNGNSTVLGSGIQFVLPGIDRVIKVDMRTVTVDIPSQEVLTEDSVTVSVDAVVYMRVIDPASAILRVEHWKVSSQLLAVSILRTVIGQYSLTNLLKCRAAIDNELRRQLDHATGPWGIKVERVEITDVSLPHDMQRAMAAEAQASRAANAKVIAAQGELDSSAMLQEAAAKMRVEPAALHLRYLQTLATIATEQNSTIVFPLPIELLSLLRNK